MFPPHSPFFTPYSFLQSIRLPFWFACFWALIGVAWRTPLASVVLLSIFLVLLAIIEWTSHQWGSQKAPFPSWGGKSEQSNEPSEESVQQQIVRSQTTEGLDRFDGTFLVQFPADAMTTTVHIPFCPTFERVPKVQVFPMDKTNVTLRVLAPKMFGVRVDVKRSDVATHRFRFAVVAEG